MKFTCFILLLLLCVLNHHFVYSQTKEIDSLKQALVHSKEDTVKINILNELSYSLYMSFEYDSSLEYGNKALEMSKKKGYMKGMGYALLYIACSNGDKGSLGKSDSLTHAASVIAYKIKDKRLIGLTYHALGGIASYKDNYKEAFNKYDTALRYYMEIGDKKLIALIMRNYGIDYNQLSNYSESIRYTYMALKYFEEVGDKSKMGECYLFIGDAYKAYGNYSESLKLYFQAQKVFEELSNKSDVHSYNKFDIAITLSSSGEVYLLQGNPGSAIDRYSSALKVFENYPNHPVYSGYIPGCNIGIGRAHELFGDSANTTGAFETAKINFSRAVSYYKKALKMSQEMNFENEEAEASVYLGILSIKQREYVSAENLLKRALTLSKKIHIIKLQRDIYLNLSKLYELTGKNDKAFDYYKKYVLYRDSIVNEEVVRKTEGYKMQYEFDKKEDRINLLSIENKLKTTLVSKQKQQKNFAYAGIAAILLTSSYGFYRYRRRKRLQNQQALISERLRISSELHDEVGATLSGIAMYSHLTKEQMKKGQMTEIEKSLNIMQQSSTQMVDKLSDIVWLINPEQDSLQKLVTRLEEYATDMAAIKNMLVKISVPEKIAGINLPVESRRNIYLFCKEAINNAVKYSHATLLELTVKEFGGNLEFSVSDNGKGFDAVMVRRGNGLENMQKRADEIGAKLTVHSKENDGASVSLQCKIG